MINTDRLADVRYACVRCVLDSSVGCALFLCSSVVDKRRMVPFGETGFDWNTRLLVLGQSGDSFTFPGIELLLNNQPRT